MMQSTATPREKRVARDYFFPTLVYHTDLAQAENLNARLVADIRAWRARDPGGTFRSNVRTGKTTQRSGSLVKHRAGLSD